MQQALRWRWLSPGGLQAVFIAAAPTSTRAGCNAAAIAARHGAPLLSPRACMATCSNLVQPAPPTNARPRRCLGTSDAGSRDTLGPGTLRRRSRTRTSAASYVAVVSRTANDSTSTCIVAPPVRSRTLNNGKSTMPGPALRPQSFEAAGPTQRGVAAPCPMGPPTGPPAGMRQSQPQPLLRRAMAPPAARDAVQLIVHTNAAPATPTNSAVGGGAATSNSSSSSGLHNSAPSGTLLHPTPDTTHSPHDAVAATALASLPLPHALPTRHIVAAVDPDLGGALAVIFWDEDPKADPNQLPAGVLPGGSTSPMPTGRDLSSSSSSSPAWALAYPRSVNALPGPLVSEAQGSEEAGAEGGEEEDNDEDEEEGDQAGGRDGAAEEDYLWLPEVAAPSPPPADHRRWSVHVWDMPTSAAHLQKRTGSGRMSKRRLLNVIGARQVLGRALRIALPAAPQPVALYGYVEVPPILPGDGSLSAYTSLWGTSAWLGLLAASGFMVGSTPVRRWKTDLGLFGARSKDAGLELARRMFPQQQSILRRKKDHGRADALLIAAWALGATLPPGLTGTLRRNSLTLDELLSQQPGVVALAWGAPRPPLMKDAYGNALTPEKDVWDEIESAQSKVARKEEARAARELKKSTKKKRASAAAEGVDASTKRRSRRAKGTVAEKEREKAEEGAQETAPRRRRRVRSAADKGEEEGAASSASGEEKAAKGGTRKEKRAAVVSSEEAPGSAELTEAGGAAAGEAAAKRLVRRRSKKGMAAAEREQEGQEQQMEAASSGAVKGTQRTSRKRNTGPVPPVEPEAPDAAKADTETEVGGGGGRRARKLKALAVAAGEEGEAVVSEGVVRKRRTSANRL